MLGKIIKMPAIEVLATIFAVLVLVKLLLFIFNPQLRIKIVESFFKANTTLLTVVYLALTAIVGYYVLSSLSIVEVGAVTLFVSGLFGLFFIQYKEIMIKLARESLKSGFLSKNWLSLLIWAVIAILVLSEVLV